MAAEKGKEWVCYMPDETRRKEYKTDQVTENFLKIIDQVLAKVGSDARVLPFNHQSVFNRLPMHLTATQAKLMVDILGNMPSTEQQPIPFWFITYYTETLLQLAADEE